MSVGMDFQGNRGHSPGPAADAAAAEAAPRSPAVPARAPRRGLLPGDADARHGVPAPGVLHPDVQGPLGRDAHRPAPAGDPGRPAGELAGPGPAERLARGRHRPGERPAGPRRGRRPGRPQGAPAGRGPPAGPRRARATASAATPGCSATARSASAWWPTTACGTSRPPGSSPRARRPASPRSAWPSPAASRRCPGSPPGREVA